MSNEVLSNNDHFKEYLAGSFIFEEGTENHNIYIINYGIIKIQKKINAKDTVLNLLVKGFPVTKYHQDPPICNP